VRRRFVITIFLLLASIAFAQPTISTLAVTYNQNATATVSWTTNTPSTTQLLYGVGVAPNQKTNAVSTLVTAHSITLSGLSSAYVYNYQAISTDGGGNTTTSAVQSFEACSGTGYTVLSGTLNNYYEYGTYALTLTNPSGSTVTPSVCGIPIPTSFSGSLTGGSSFSTNVPDNLKMVPSPAQWSVTVTGIDDSIGSSTSPITIAGTSMDISTILQAATSNDLIHVWFSPSMEIFYPPLSGSSYPGVTSDGSSGLAVTGNVKANNVVSKVTPVADVRAFGGTCNGSADDTSAFQSAINSLATSGGTVFSHNCKINASSITFPTSPSIKIIVDGALTFATGTNPLTVRNLVDIIGTTGDTSPLQFSMGNAAFINCDTTSVCLQYNADYNAIPGGYSKLSNIEITAHTTAPSVDLNAANFVQFDNVKLSGQSTVMTMESVMWAQFNNSIFAVSSPWGTGGTNSATGLGNANQYAIHYSVPAGPYPEGSNIHFNQSRILGTGILIDATTDIVGGGIGPWYIDGLRYQSGLTSLITLSTLNHGVLRSLEISDLDNEDNQCWNGSSWLVNSCGTYQWPLIYITPGYTNTIGRLYGDFLGQWAGPLVNPGAPQIDSGSISGEPTVAMYSLGGQSNIKLDTTGSTNTPIRPTTIPYATQSLNAWGGTFTTVPGPDGVATSGVAYTSSAPWNSTLWSIPESSASAGDWFIVGGWVQGTGTQQYGTCGYQIYDLSSTGGAFNGSGNPQVSILPASQENTDKAWYFVSTAAKLTTKGTGGTITFIANGPGGSFCASDATNYSSPFVVWVHNPTVTDAEVIRWKNDMLVGIIPGGVSAGTVIGGTGSAFGALTGGTNTAAAMLVGTGASLAPTGTGTISANATAGMAATGSITFNSGAVQICWNTDTCIQKGASGQVSFGNGTAFDKSGSALLGSVLFFNGTYRTWARPNTLTADRNLILPDADSNPVQPLSSAPTGGCVGYIDSAGVQHGAACSIPTTGIATLSSGTVTVSTSAACTPSSTCTYKLTNCALNGSTAIGVPAVGTISVGTSFVINSYTAIAGIAVDSSKICWAIN
jgi:hypothetical protein